MTKYRTLIEITPPEILQSIYREPRIANAANRAYPVQPDSPSKPLRVILPRCIGASILLHSFLSNVGIPLVARMVAVKVAHWLQAQVLELSTSCCGHFYTIHYSILLPFLSTLFG